MEWSKMSDAQKRNNVIRYQLFVLLIKLSLWPSFYYNNEWCPMTPAHPDFKTTIKKLYGVRRV